MGKILKALILGWIGKKIYDRVTADDEPAEPEPVKNVAHAKRAAPKRTSHKPTRRSPRAA